MSDAPRPPVPDGPYVVAGLGQAGLAAIAALRRARPEARVIAWDASASAVVRHRARQLRRRGVESVVARPIGEALDRAGERALVVRSPGIARDAPPLREARAHGCQVLDELEIGWRLHRQPCIGITGTNGKGTTATLTAGLLRSRGLSVAVAGNFAHGPALSDGGNSGADCIVCEASSFQLELSDAFLPDIAVFTNLTPTHMHRHRSGARYATVKARMFVRQRRPAAVSVINIDDPFGRQLAAYLRSLGGTVIGYGSDPLADVRLVGSSWDERHSDVELIAHGRRASARVALIGRHNVMNAVAAIATVGACGIDLVDACDGIGSLAGPPARLQRVDADLPFGIFVDYAHTRDGVVSVLGTLREIADRRPGARLLVLTGPLPLDEGLDAGAWLTPVVAEFADTVTVTTGHISRVVDCAQVVAMARMRKAGGVTKAILDREAAIGDIVCSARTGDVVLILSRGDLREMKIDQAGSRVEFDDVASIRRACDRRARGVRSCR